MALIIAILPSWLSSADKMRIFILFVINNVAKSLKELVFDPPEWNCWMFWNMVASVGAKYILKYSERLGKQESHLSADRWSLTNKKPPTFPYSLLCFPVGIPYFLQEAIIPYCKGIPLHGKKRTSCSGLMKTALNNVVLPTLFNVVNNIVQHCWAWISPQSGVTMLNNIVDNIEQCGQHNIVEGCFYQPWTGCAFLCVYEWQHW